MRFLALASALTLSLPAAAQPVWDHAQPITIDMANFAFSPATVSLRRGVVYRLHFQNRGRGAHDFTAPGFFAQATIDPNDLGKLGKGGVELRGGESADLRLVANQPGRYAVRCTHFLHKAFGMTGRIIVT
jgi:uncharacterized cupredoxin-like copper-binding protein